MKGARIQPESSALSLPTRAHSTLTWKSTWTINGSNRVNDVTKNETRPEVRGFSRRDSRMLALKSVVVIALPLLSLTVLLCLSVADAVIEGRMSGHRDCTSVAVAKVTFVLALVLERKMATRYLQHPAARQRQQYRSAINATSGSIADDGCDTDGNTRMKNSLVEQRQRMLDLNVTSDATWLFYSDVISNELSAGGDAYTCRLESSCVVATYLHHFVVSVDLFELDEFVNLRENTTDVGSDNVGSDNVGSYNVGSDTASGLSQYIRLFYSNTNSLVVFTIEDEISQKLWDAYNRTEDRIMQAETPRLGSDIAVILEITTQPESWQARINVIVIVILSVFTTSVYLLFLVRFANRLYKIPGKVRSFIDIVDRKSGELEVGRQRSDALLQQVRLLCVRTAAGVLRRIEGMNADRVIMFLLTQ